MMFFTTALLASLATSIALYLELLFSTLIGGSLVIVVAIAYIVIAHYFIDVSCFIGRWADRGSCKDKECMSLGTSFTPS